MPFVVGITAAASLVGANFYLSTTTTSLVSENGRTVSFSYHDNIIAGAMLAPVRFRSRSMTLVGLS
jgi:hypothetical protein